MYFEEIKLGTAMETSRIQISREKMVSFATDYDPLPLHTDEEYAKKTRFGKLIAPGIMVFMSVWAKYIEEIDYTGDQLIAGKSTNVEWFLPVYAGDTVYGKAAVTALMPRNPYNGTAEITIEVFNQDNALVLRAVTETVVARRKPGTKRRELA